MKWWKFKEEAAKMARRALGMKEGMQIACE
jgi:hypothetical protein